MAERINLLDPVQPRHLTGLKLDPRTNEPVVQMQILGTLPFKFLIEKADPDSLRRIASMAIARLQELGERW